MLTAKEAKEVCLRVWGYLVDHPEISRKSNLPEDLREEIRGMLCSCPLCQYIVMAGLSCSDCPLGVGGSGCGPSSLYEVWANAKGPFDRKAAATSIVNWVKAWDVEGLKA
jgi:hypothetical protein